MHSNEICDRQEQNGAEKKCGGGKEWEDGGYAIFI